MGLNKLGLCFFCLGLWICAVEGKVQHGSIQTGEEPKNLVLMDTFVFGTNNANHLEYEIHLPANSSHHEIAIFDDDQWAAVRHNDNLTCSEKVAKITDPSLKISLASDSDICNVVQKGDEKWLVCKGFKDFSTQQSPHRYFLHLTNCHGRGTRAGISNATYTLHMTNGLGYLNREFSYDQRFIFGTDLGFLIGYVTILLVGTATHVILSKRHLLYITYRLFYLSLVMQVLSLSFHCLALGNFASDGHDLPWINILGYITYSLSSVLFVAMLLLVSKGYTITRARLSLDGFFKVTFYALLYAASYLVFFTLEYILSDPSDILDLDDYKPAAGLIACRIAGFMWTLHCVFFTMKSHPEKAMFYVPFALVFGVWFLAEPASIYLASSISPKIDSACISNGLQWLTAFLGHIFFMVLTMPVSLNKCFPFTIPVMKVDSMKTADVESCYGEAKESSELPKVLNQALKVVNETPKVSYDFGINGKPISARGSVKSVKSCDSKPIVLPRIFLHDDDDSGKERVTGSTTPAERTSSPPSPLTKAITFLKTVQPLPLSPARPRITTRQPKRDFLMLFKGKNEIPKIMYDFGINGRPVSARGSVKSVKYCDSKPIILPRILLHDGSDAGSEKENSTESTTPAVQPAPLTQPQPQKSPVFARMTVREKPNKPDTTSTWSNYFKNEQQRLKSLLKHHV